MAAAERASNILPRRTLAQALVSDINFDSGRHDNDNDGDDDDDDDCLLERDGHSAQKGGETLSGYGVLQVQKQRHDSHLRRYADVLLRWGMLDARAEVRVRSRT